jgi:hypothetical protein
MNVKSVGTNTRVIPMPWIVKPAPIMPTAAMSKHSRPMPALDRQGISALAHSNDRHDASAPLDAALANTNRRDIHIPTIKQGNKARVAAPCHVSRYP